MIESLFLSLAVLLMITYFSFNKDIISPSFLFIGGFTICSYIAFLYKNEWKMDELHFATCYIIVGGGILCYVTELFYRKKYRYVFMKKNIVPSGFSPIRLNKLIFFALFQLIVYALVARYKMTCAGSDLASSIAAIDQEVKYNEESSFALPWYLNISNAFCQVTGFIWGCLFVYYYYLPKKYTKQRIFILVNLVIAMIGTLLSGGRMPLLDHLMAFIVIWFVYYRLRVANPKKLGLSLKMKLTILSVVLIFVTGFTFLGSLIGREKSELGSEYLFAVYCGAQIRNLDDYTTDKYIKKNLVFGEKTLRSFYNFFQDRLGMSILKDPKPEKIGFNYSNGYFLGNVYSSYKPWFDDFQYACIFVMIPFSFLACFLYRKCLMSSFFVSGKLDFWILLYCLLVSSIFQSFFSELFLRRALSVEYILRALFYFYVGICILEGKIVKFSAKF